MSDQHSMTFTPGIIPPGSCAEQCLWFMIRNQEIVVEPGRDTYRIPSEDTISVLQLKSEQAHFLGLWNGQCCYTIECPSEMTLPEHLQFIPLREAFIHFPADGVQVVSLATQIITWDRSFRYCGQCGQPTIELKEERAKICKACGLTNYPRLSPSIIVSVTRKKSILLARSPRFPKGMYSVLAGFVEPGETLEECVQREIREEVGIEVKNIRYFGSQNWPFPHSMMIGFTAEHAEGEIMVDNKEIVDAQWFTVEEVPRLPGSYSIARKLIDHFINESSSMKL